MRLFLLWSLVSALELDEMDIDAEFTMSDIQESISENDFEPKWVNQAFNFLSVFEKGNFR